MYWLRFTRAIGFEEGVWTELSTEKPECFQAKSFWAKLFYNRSFLIKSIVTLLLNSSVSREVFLMGMRWKEPVSSFPLKVTNGTAVCASAAGRVISTPIPGSTARWSNPTRLSRKGVPRSRSWKASRWTRSRRPRRSSRLICDLVSHRRSYCPSFCVMIVYTLYFYNAIFTGSEGGEAKDLIFNPKYSIDYHAGG